MSDPPVSDPPVSPPSVGLEVDIAHSFGAFRLEVAFSAPRGVTALFGRSGSGKTTLVNAVAGLLRPDRGRVVVEGTPLLDSERGLFLPAHRRRVGYVFQEGRLFPHLTVRQNLTFGRWFAPRGPRDREAERLVELLGLARLLERRPAGLSGGEKQRVAIGRALLSRPRLLLMDEPLASLDEARKAEILPYLERLRDETRVPIVYVSHALPEVARLATTLVVIGEGRLLRCGDAETLLADPESVPLLGVREAGALLTARVVRHHPEDALTELAASAGRLLLPRLAAAPGTSLRLRIEAQDIILARRPPAETSALNILPATVTAIHEGSGPGAAVGLLAGSDRLLARITRRSLRSLGLAPGEACYAILKATSIARSDVGAAEGRHGF